MCGVKKIVSFFFAMVWFTSLQSQSDPALAALENEKKKLLQDEKELRLELRNKQGYLQTLTEKTEEINELRRIQADSGKYYQRLQELDRKFSKNSKIIKDRSKEAEMAEKAIPQLEKTIKSLEDSLTKIKLELDFSNSVNSRDSLVNSVEKETYEQYLSSYKKISDAGGEYTVAREFVTQELNKRVNLLLSDTGRMDYNTAKDYEQFANMVAGNNDLHADARDAIARIKNLSHVFRSCQSASEILGKNYSSDSTELCKNDLTTSLQFVEKDPSLSVFRNKLLYRLNLISEYCRVTKKFWNGVKTIAEIQIKEIAKAKLDRLLPGIATDYLYLRNQAGPILSDLPKAKIEAKEMLPQLKCN